MQTDLLILLLKNNKENFHPVVPFNPQTEKLFPFDFTENNKELTPQQIADTDLFAKYINEKLLSNYCKYGIGGYGEHRTIYARSKHFDTSEEPRRLHLGTDIWGEAGTKVMAPFDGIVHSFAFNNNDSDYGATIILTHNINGISFLYFVRTSQFKFFKKICRKENGLLKAKFLQNLVCALKTETGHHICICK